MGDSHPNAYICVQGRECHVYVATHITFHISAAFFLSALFYFQKFSLTFILKRCVRQKRLFLTNEINFCRHETSFFCLKLFLKTQTSQNAFNFHRIESKVYSIIQCATSLRLKSPVQHSAGNKVYFIFLILFKNYLTSILTEFV